MAFLIDLDSVNCFLQYNIKGIYKILYVLKQMKIPHCVKDKDGGWTFASFCRMCTIWDYNAHPKTIAKDEQY